MNIPLANAKFIDSTDRGISNETRNETSPPSSIKPACVVQHVLTNPIGEPKDGGKIDNRVQFINQRKRPGRNDPCPKHKEFKFKRCPHGCAKEARIVLGKVVQKIVKEKAETM